MTCSDLFPPGSFDDFGVKERDGVLYHEVCGREFFNGCHCYIGEWKCRACGEYTYPFSGLKIEDGCIHCGCPHVVQPPPEEAIAWRGNFGLPWC